MVGQPRVLFVSDNRDNPNWGSRSTSMALLELLESGGLKPNATVMDSDVRLTTPVARLAPLDAALARRPFTRLARAALARGDRTRKILDGYLGVTDDVSDDPITSVNRWLEAPREPFVRWPELIRNADAVIINGEGSMIFTPHPRREQRFHLALMQLALTQGVPYLYVNALASDPPLEPRNEKMYQESVRLLRSASLVTARDPESQRYFTAMAPDVPATYVPDAVFTWYSRLNHQHLKDLLAAPEYLKPFHPRPDLLGEWRFDTPYLCVGGSSEAAKDPARALKSYGALARKMKDTGLPVYMTASCSGDAFLEEIARELELPLIPAVTNVWVASAILANAAAVITGRYHPTILAGLGGAPCILLGADSHKTTSVQTMLGYPEIHTFPMFPDTESIAAIARQVAHVLEERAAWSRQIRSTAEERAGEAAGLAALLGQACRR